MLLVLISAFAFLVFYLKVCVILESKFFDSWLFKNYQIRCILVSWVLGNNDSCDLVEVISCLSYEPLLFYDLLVGQILSNVSLLNHQIFIFFSTDRLTLSQKRIDVFDAEWLAPNRIISLFGVLLMTGGYQI